MVVGTGFSISVGINAVDGDHQVEWQELTAVQFTGCELFHGNKEFISVRLARGLIHHVVVERVTGTFDEALVEAKTVKRIISRKTKSKQQRRVWVHSKSN